MSPDLRLPKPETVCGECGPNYSASQMTEHARKAWASRDEEVAQLRCALKIALWQLEILGGRERLHPKEGQDEIHANVLEVIDAAIATGEQNDR